MASKKLHQNRLFTTTHVVYTEEVNKIALISNDNKRLQTFYRITTYPHGTNAFKVCKSDYVDCPFYDEIILQQQM